MGSRDAADAAVVRRCQAGEREAFGELVAAYQDRVYGLALRWCRGDRAEAGDLAQDTFLRAYAAVGRFDPRRPFAPWLLRIAINRCRDAARRRRTRPSVSMEVDPDAFAEPAPGPEAAAVAAEERRAVRAAVAALPDAQRLLVVLAYDRELRLIEIAEALGLPLSMVKNRLMRARRAIAKRLAAEDAEGPGPNGCPAGGSGRHDVRRGALPTDPLRAR